MQNSNQHDCKCTSCSKTNKGISKKEKADHYASFYSREALKEKRNHNVLEESFKQGFFLLKGEKNN